MKCFFVVIISNFLCFFLLLKVLSILLLSSYPFIGMLAGVDQTLLVNFASVLKNVLSVSAVC